MQMTPCSPCPLSLTVRILNVKYLPSPWYVTPQIPAVMGSSHIPPAGSLSSLLFSLFSHLLAAPAALLNLTGSECVTAVRLLHVSHPPRYSCALRPKSNETFWTHGRRQIKTDPIRQFKARKFRSMEPNYLYFPNRRDKNPLESKLTWRSATSDYLCLKIGIKMSPKVIVFLFLIQTIPHVFFFPLRPQNSSTGKRKGPHVRHLLHLGRLYLIYNHLIH